MQKEIKLKHCFLEKIFEGLGCLPKRNVVDKQEFLEFFANTDILIIDVTEQRITHPSGGSNTPKKISRLCDIKIIIHTYRESLV